MAGRLIRAFVVLLLAGIAAAAAGAWWAARWLDAPGPAGESRVIEITPGASLGRVAGMLEAEGLIEHAQLFEWYGRLSGNAARLRAGEYQIPARASPRELMDRLVSGDVVLHALTIIEGWTFAEMRRVLQAHPAVRVTLEGVAGEALMAELGMPGMTPEGWFLPETYRFPRGTTDREVLRIAHEAMKAVLEAAWERRKPGLPLESPYEALILASIVEKETGLDSERAQVAGVFERRLELGMRLQTDPTIIYGLGEDFDGNLRRRDLERDGPYNTYTRSGLPPTPIALPGKASVEAAVAPADGEALYFVATGRPDGSHYFSRTLEEHNEAVRRYLKTLRERRQQR